MYQTTAVGTAMGEEIAVPKHIWHNDRCRPLPPKHRLKSEEFNTDHLRSFVILTHRRNALQRVVAFGDTLAYTADCHQPVQGFALYVGGNEAELWYCVGDLDALCDAWGYKAILEETVKDQHDHHLPVSFLRSLPFRGLCEHLLVATKPRCLKELQPSDHWVFGHRAPTMPSFR